jgi:4-hydroxythreonine-4-phosphate dehydrogenase
MTKKILVTMGDACGIGPETIVKAIINNPFLSSQVVVVGDRNVMSRAAGLFHRTLNELNIAIIQSGPSLNTEDLPFGQVTAAAGQAAFDAIYHAVQCITAGEASAMVTAPISKQALQTAGHRYPGHTELLAELAGPPKQPLPVRMMLANHELRTVLVSIHLSLRQALDAVSYANILETLCITDCALRAHGIKHPRLAVAGLNPHAGEAGIFGREEIDIISPAIKAAALTGINASGPYPPDTIFMRARGFTQYDAVIAMYHDQGLIPVKYLGVEHGVNVTLGLPFIRTSPDHGTAFDIAGSGHADASSLTAAISYAKQHSVAN